MMPRVIAGAALFASIGAPLMAATPGAPPAAVQPATHLAPHAAVHATGRSGGDDAVASLRSQNAALRERMARLQLDLLIADILADGGRDRGGVRRAAAAVPAQVALRR